MIADLINGSFELCGGFFVLLSVVQAWRDKQVRGVSLLTIMFMSSWGVWNLYYYPSLGQLLSFYGGIFIVAANTLWLIQVIYYRRTERAKVY